MNDDDAPAGGRPKPPPTLLDDTPWTGDEEGPRGLLSLPSALAGEWTVVRDIASFGSEGDLVLVSDRAGARHAVAKIYRAGHTPNADVLAKLTPASHPHVVDIFGFGSSEGRFYELQEYAALGTLEKLIAREGPQLGEELVERILFELAAAIAHVHELDIVHRDVKPSNVLVRTRAPELDLVLTDFGTAAPLHGMTSRITKVRRTAAYAAPESVAGAASRPSDWWSLGIILVEILTGRHPFTASSGTLMHDEAITARVAQMPVESLVAGVEGRWRDLCRGLLRRNAKNRWGYTEIVRWRNSDPTLTVVDEQAPGPAVTPFFFDGRNYDSLPELAAAFGAKWDKARKTVGRGGHFETWAVDDLKSNEWKQFFADFISPDVDERLFNIRAKLDPSAAPVFWGYTLDADGLEQLAHDALADKIDAQLAVKGLLGGSTFSRAAELTGVQRYRELHAGWKKLMNEYERVLAAVVSGGGPASDDPVYRYVAAEMLLASLPGNYPRQLRAKAAALATPDARECTWFDSLGEPSTASSPAAFVIAATAARARGEGRRRRTQVFGTAPEERSVTATVNDPNVSAFGLAPNVAAGLASLFGIVGGIVILFGTPAQHWVRFVAFQAILLCLASFAGTVVLLVLGVVHLAMLFSVPKMLYDLALLVAWILVTIRAFQGAAFRLPIIGDLAESWSESSL